MVGDLYAVDRASHGGADRPSELVVALVTGIRFFNFDGLALDGGPGKARLKGEIQAIEHSAWTVLRLIGVLRERYEQGPV